MARKKASPPLGIPRDTLGVPRTPLGVPRDALGVPKEPLGRTLRAAIVAAEVRQAGGGLGRKKGKK